LVPFPPNLRNNRTIRGRQSQTTFSKWAHLGESEILSEIALAPFARDLPARDRLTLAQAAGLANRPQLDFQSLLADRGTSIHL
jgi:predicted HTH domain antitoxin